MTIKDRFDNAVEYLYGINDYLSAEVTKLGYPEYVKDIPTAGVSWDADNKKVRFMFNKKFANTLTDQEFAFVVAHEAMHLINMHVFLFREKIDQAVAKKKNNAEVSAFRYKLNIAADCVVNDSLTSLYGLDRIPSIGRVDSKDGPKPLPLFYGQNVVKVDTYDMTVMEVYYLIPDNPSAQGESQDHEWSSFAGPDGSINQDFIDQISDFIDNNQGNSATSDEEQTQIDKMKEALQNSSDPNARRAGNEPGKQARAIDGLGHNAISWSKILFQFVETKRVVDNWNRPNRKLMSIYPDAIIPSYIPEEKEEIFIAIDSSSSIDNASLKLLLEVARNTPSRFKVKAITFDTQCYEYDVKGSKYPVGRGGTDFQIIEEYIQKNFKRYPRCVVVLTDGSGTPLSPQYPDRWMWLLYKECNTNYTGKMKHYNIMDILNKLA